MKALVCSDFGKLESLQLIENSLPKPNENEVLIRVAACGLNFPDLLILNNKYQYKPELPFVPGGEITGVITEVGAGVEEFKVGQRVFAIERWGGLTENIVLSKDRVYPLSDQMSFVEGASLVYNLSTAWYALKNRAKAKPGERILILGASGGVGLAAIQLAKILGLEVIAAASTEAKLAFCKSYGADKLINYTNENIKERILELSEGIGVDIVLDTVGDIYADSAMRSLKWQGRYLVVGFASGDIPKIPLNVALLKGIDIRGVFWGKFSRDEAEKQKENILELMHYYSEGKIRPYVGQTYNFDDAVSAMKGLADRNRLGKSIVICNSELIENNIVIRKAPREKFVFRSKEHILESVGKDLGESTWFQVTQEMINNFADATDDYQWIHIQPKLASRTPMGGTIAHGFLTISLSPKFLTEIYEMPFAKMGINYGVDKLRFILPVKVNSKIKMKAKLISAEQVKNDGIKLKIEANYFIENSDRPVCSAELLSIVY